MLTPAVLQHLSIHHSAWKNCSKTTWEEDLSSPCCNSANPEVEMIFTSTRDFFFLLSLKRKLNIPSRSPSSRFTSLFFAVVQELSTRPSPTRETLDTHPPIMKLQHMQLMATKVAPGILLPTMAPMLSVFCSKP